MGLFLLIVPVAQVVKVVNFVLSLLFTCALDPSRQVEDEDGVGFGELVPLEASPQLLSLLLQRLLHQLALEGRLEQLILPQHVFVDVDVAFLLLLGVRDLGFEF